MKENSLRGGKKCQLGRKPIFTTELGKEIADHVLELARLYYGLTPIKLRKLIFEFAEAKNVNHTFNTDKKLAGKDWLRLFLKRNPQITLRQPEGTSLNRIAAFNKKELTRFFTNLEHVMAKYQFSTSRIFNVDETGVTTVPKKSPKVYSQKGKKRVGSAISAERGRTITVYFV